MNYAVSVLPNGALSYRSITTDADLLPGETFSAEPPAPTMADAAAALMPAVQAWLDATAQANGYDSLASCISYHDDPVAQWADDAAAAQAWRSAVWVAAFQWQQDALANPPATFPDAATVIATLPQPEQFGWVSHLPGQA